MTGAPAASPRNDIFSKYQIEENAAKRLLEHPSAKTTINSGHNQEAWSYLDS